MRGAKVGLSAAVMIVTMELHQPALACVFLEDDTLHAFDALG